ncbi:MAG: hypothetical protein PHS52_06580 [Desulfotomaculaceae bacterium]|nr:hypothetical protein [Desulfotomaculaceae bacterium]
MELERMGVPWTRDSAGGIAQRPLGGGQLPVFVAPAAYFSPRDNGR